MVAAKRDSKQSGIGGGSGRIQESIHTIREENDEDFSSLKTDSISSDISSEGEKKEDAEDGENVKVESQDVDDAISFHERDDEKFVNHMKKIGNYVFLKSVQKQGLNEDRRFSAFF